MTAEPPSSGAKSASSTIDPDAQARRANDGELSAGFQSDLTTDEDAVDGLLTAEEFPDRAIDESFHKGTVVRGVSSARRRTGSLAPSGHVGRARGRTVGRVRRGGQRDAPIRAHGHRRIVALRDRWRNHHRGCRCRSPALANWPVGTRTPVDGNTLATVVQRTRPARADGQLRQHRRADRRTHSRGGRARCGGGARSSLMDACGAWRRSVRLNPGRCRPTPRPASAASPN